MGLFGASKEIKRLQAQVQQLQSLNIPNQINQNFQNFPIYPSWDIKLQSERYCTTDDIYSIIRLLAVASARIPLYGYLRTTDKKAFAQLAREFKSEINPRKLKEIQKKALDDLPETDPVAMLLDNPNDSMSRFAFFESIYSYLYLDGEAFLLKQRPPSGANQGMPIQLLPMVPECVILKISQTLPRTITAYDYRVAGNLIYENIPAEDVIHIKYWNPKIDFLGNELRGLSPLKVLLRRLTRLDSNMDVSVAQLQNGGTNTIVYDKDLANQDGSKEIIDARKDAFYKFLKNRGNAGAPYFASGEMGSIQLGSKLMDMGVIELADVDFKKVCNVWNVSDRLFNNDATGSEISDDNARKGLYNNAVLPNVDRVKDALIKGLLPDFQNGIVLEEDGEIIRIPGDGKLRFIDKDVTQIPELHEDIAKKVAQYSNLPIMIPNMILEVLGFPTYEDDPLMAKVYIKAGYTPIDEMQPIEPIDTTPDEGNLGNGQ